MGTNVSIRSTIRSEVQEFLNLAVPLASAQVAQAAVGFVDTLMMGNLGQASLAAGGLASTSVQFLLATTSGLVMAVSPLVAEAVGAGRQQQIGQIARQGLWLSLLLSLPLMRVLADLDRIMLQLGQAASTVAIANGYLDWVLWGLFPALGFAMLRGYVAALGQAQAVIAIVLLGTAVNGFGNYVLGYGKFGFPRMELAGLGLASAISFWVMFLALLVYALKHPQLRTYRLWQDLHRLNPQLLGRLIRIGVTIAVTIALEYGLFTAITYLMGRLGVEVLAAHQIVYQTSYLLFMVPLGLSYAATIRVGQWLGQQDRTGMRRAGLVSVAVAALVMLLMTLVLLASPQSIIGIYLDIDHPANAAVLNLAVPMLVIAAFAQVLDAVQRVAMGALYGLQDMRLPMLLSILAFWGIGLTSGYSLGFGAGLGGVGLWLGQSVGVAIAGLIFLWRFHWLTRNRHRPAD